MSSSSSERELSPDKNIVQKQPEVKEDKSGNKISNPFYQFIPHPSPQNDKEKKNQTNTVQQKDKNKINTRQNSSSSPKSVERQRERSREKTGNHYQGKTDQKNWKNIRDSESSNRNDSKHYDLEKKYNYDNRLKNQQKQFKDYRKTKICPAFQNGTCRKGLQCNFAHGQNQLRLLPDYRKTKLCLAFKEGKCGRLSSQCKYAHGQGQLRKPPQDGSEQRAKDRRQQRPKKYHHNYPKQDYQPPIHAPVYQPSYPFHYPPYPNTPQYGNNMPPPQPYYYYPPIMRQPQPSNHRSSSPTDFENPMYYPPQPPMPNIADRGQNLGNNSMPMSYPPPPPPPNYEYYESHMPPNYRYPPVDFFQAF